MFVEESHCIHCFIENITATKVKVTLCLVKDANFISLALQSSDSF